MKKKNLVILFFLIAISSAYTQSFSILGTWKIYDPPKDFRGTLEYKIFQKGEEIYIQLNSTFEVRAFYDEDAKIIIYLLDGLWPNGPLEKLQFEDGFLRLYTLYKNKWVVHNLYSKQ